ncbi:two-component sensor histidine kinase [Streptomyces populi]|uniref:histidine kinase n=2 Tax=Streptomyces populi TaxID=2058924 RepID=A0A2I0STC3_9ACTN|nr:HAMP domain-containing sensor histidine kinase [Streptomyces populi]PKT73170.1 two-component sensor histidine kinase [Streptomyces populi]
MVLWATAVVTVALVAAGIAVLMSLRVNLTGQAQSEANDTARRIALGVATWRGGDARLPLPEGAREGVPVQVTDEDGRLLAVGAGLESISGTGVTAVRVPRTTASPTVPAPSPSPSVSPAAAPGPATQLGTGTAESHGGGHGRDRNRGNDDGPDDSASDDGGSDDKGTDDSGSSGHGTDDDGADAGPTPRTDDPAIGTIGDTVQEGSGHAVVHGRSAPYRFATVKATDLGGRTVLVHAGASLAARESAVRSTAVAMLAGLPLVLLVVGGVTWLVTRRALAPVEGIRREMAAITASEDLSRRVPEPASHDEVARLARTTNETLTALEAAVDRQRRFVADASHELRSPIASLRTQLEVGSAHPQLLDVPGAVKDTERLQHLAADLLLLARLDAGERPGQGRVDLGELVREELGRRPADRAPVSFHTDGEHRVTGSRGQLTRVVGNLLDNAQRHARAEVVVSVTARGDRIVLTVADDGSGVPASERERIFERFVRLDDARARDDGGAGLGLAIARDVARRHGGTLTAGEAPSGGALFELRLPVAAAPSPEHGAPEHARES